MNNIRPQKIVQLKRNSLSQTIDTLTKELLHCRQFILGPDFVDVMPGWKHIDIDYGLKLSIHPEVEVEQIAYAGKKLTVIGDILDSVSPKKSNRDILSDLINKADDLDTLTRATGPYGGRWILIASFGDKKYLFNDALGLRQVFYTDPAITDALWMVSQPGLAGKYLNLESDEEADKFLESYSARTRIEFRWPAAATPFRGLTHLLPNLYLDLNTGQSHRYWPYASIGIMPTKEAEIFIEQRMSNLMRAAAARYPLSIAITAGIDSRLVMALSKDISNEICFVTVRQADMQDDHPDISIPDHLCKDLGLKRVVIKAKPSMSADFSKLFKDSVHMATDIYGRDAEAIINQLQRKMATVTGSAGEIGQCYFRNYIAENKYNGPMDASELATMQRVANEPFAIKHFQTWLDAANNRHNIKLMDLFYWEHSHGNWLAMTQMQFDIAWREIFTPYNCRDVLQAFLSVDEEDRIQPHVKIYRNIISRAWPQLLDQPINPHKVVKLSIKRKIKNFIKSKIKRARKIISGR
jgi:hypothetical protein